MLEQSHVHWEIVADTHFPAVKKLIYINTSIHEKLLRKFGSIEVRGHKCAASWVSDTHAIPYTKKMEEYKNGKGNR